MLQFKFHEKISDSGYLDNNSGRSDYKMRFIYSKAFLIFAFCLALLVAIMFLQSRGWLDVIKLAVLEAPRPVVVLTNIGDVETISKIVEAGAVDYLLKSDQSVDDIIQKVKDVLARSVKLT